MTVDLEFLCHARPPQSAQIEFVIDNKIIMAEIAPTINWVMSSTPRGSRSVVVPTNLGTVNFCITAQHSDVIICGYRGCVFNYVTQPVWSDGSVFMDITGHGADKDLQGPGSLVLPVGVTVTFTAQVSHHGYGA